MKRIILFSMLMLMSATPQAAELAGVHVDDKITVENGETLVLNGIGLREKLWIDIYVGSLYLANPSNKVGEILSSPNAFRIQMDFIYKEVVSDKLITAWREGFEKNQSESMLAALKNEIEQFYSFFADNAVAKDQYILDYIPGKGTSISKNDTPLGVITGVDFKNALLEIWLGNYPADKALKRGMLGL